MGRSFEYQVRNELRDLGLCVIRSAASQGPFDLVAFSSRKVYFIQCKCTRNLKLNFSSVISEIKKIKVPKNVQKELWIKTIKKNRKNKIEVLIC